jgi:hypothetical protein
VPILKVSDGRSRTTQAGDDSASHLTTLGSSFQESGPC